MPPPESFPPHTGVTFVPTSHHDTYPAIDPSKADLSGKVVLVTGASKGIGKAISIAYARAGVSGLALLARSKDGLEDTQEAALSSKPAGKDLKIATVSVDITDSDGVAAALKKVESTFGRLDIVVNNAGLMDHFKRLGDVDPTEWWAIWTVNIKGLFNVTRSALSLLTNAHDGLKTIVNLTTVGAHLGNTHVSAYQTSKLSILRLSEVITAEYRDKGILSYSIHPGTIATDMSAQLPQDWMHFIIDTAELAADSIVFYSKERRDWLAGRYISALWDVDEFLAKKQEVISGDKLKVRMVV